MTPFISFKPGDHRVELPLAPTPVPLRPAPSLMDMPESGKAILLPDEKNPKPLAPTFKDLFLQKREQFRKSAEGMEGMMVRQVLKAMRSTIPEPEEEEDLFGSTSHATQMFTQMMDDELADKVAFNSEFGISHKIMKSHMNQLTQEFADQLASGQTTPFGLPLPPR